MRPRLRNLKALLFWLRSSLHFLRSEAKHHQNASEEKLKSFKIITSGVPHANDSNFGKMNDQCMDSGGYFDILTADSIFEKMII